MDEKFGQFGSNSFDGFGGFQGFGEKPTQSVDELLLLAKMHGGAVADVADELTHPEVSILSTVGNGFKNLFTGFIDTISLGSYAVAGALSKEKTVGQAIDERLTPSEVLLGKSNLNKEDPIYKKVGNFVVRTAIDVLTDPLTYVTFGAGAARGLGIAGVRALPKVLVAGKEMMLTQQGDNFLKSVLKGQAEGLGNIKSWSKTDIGNMAMSLGKQQGLKGKELKTFIEEAKKSVEMGRNIGAHDEVTKLMVNTTISSKLDKKVAAETMGRMLTKNPGLGETFLDKGGIKFMGHSILSGQRIASTFELIGKTTRLDEVTTPLRTALGSTKSIIGGVLGDPTGKIAGDVERETIEQLKYIKDLGDRKKNDVLINTANAWSKLGLSKNETNLIVSAIETEMRPADSYLGRLWDMAHNIPPKDITPQELDIFKGIRIFQKQTKQNLRELREAGYRIVSHKNYVPHFVEADIQDMSGKLAAKLSGKSTISTKTGMGIFARISKYRNVDDLSHTSTELLGDPDMLGLKQEYRVEELQRIKDNHLDTISKIDSTVKEIDNQTMGLFDKINEFFSGKVKGQLDTLLDNLPAKDKYTAQALFDVARKYMKPVDIEALTKQRAKATMEAGVKIKEAVGGLSEEAIEKLRQNILKGVGDLPMAVDDLNELLATTKPQFKKSVHTKGAEGELADIADKMKEATILARKEFIDDYIDKEDFAKFLDEIHANFMENPTGVNRVLDQILGNKQKIGDLMHQMELEKLAYYTNKSDVPAMAKYWRDKDGKIYERIRASIDEAEQLGVKFDKSAATVMMRASLETIRATTAKHMIDAIAKYGVPASKASDNWVPISIKGLKEEVVGMSELVTARGGEQLMYSPEMAKRVEEFFTSVVKDEATSEIMKKFDSIQNIFKASVTSIWPAFHGRNAISNVFQNYLDIGLHALDPVKHIQSASIINSEKTIGGLRQQLALTLDNVEASKLQAQINKISNKVIFTDDVGIEWTHGMLSNTMKDNGIAFNPNATGYMDLGLTREQQIDQLKNSLFADADSTGMAIYNKAQIINPLSQQFGGYKIGRVVGNVVEDQARILNFMTNLMQTGDVSLAAGRTKQFLFDYSSLTDFEKTFLRRLIPFYTWTKKNIELQAKTLMSAPGRIGAEIHAGRNLQDAFSGAELTDEEKSYLPDYLKNSLAAGTSLVTSKDGSKLTIQNTVQLPIEAAFTQAQFNNIFSALSPFVKVPIEQATGYSFYRGKALADITNATGYHYAPQAVKDFIGYTEESYKDPSGKAQTAYISVRPYRLHLLNNLPLNARSQSVLNQLMDADKTTADNLITQLTGFSQNELDIDLQQKLKEGELKDKLIKVLKNAKVGREFHKFYIPQE